MKIPPVYVMHHKSFLSIIHKTFLVYQNLGIVVQIALLGTWVFYLHCINVSSSNSQWRSIHAILRGVTHKIVDSNNLLCLKTQAIVQEFFWLSAFSNRFDEGLTLETSAFFTLYGGQYTFSTQLLTINYLLLKKWPVHN